MDRKFKKGDVIKVYSLQSFSGGGFINGTEGIVSQDQIGGSVIVAIPREYGSATRVDPSYEVYPEQLRLVKEAPPPPTILERFTALLKELKG